MNYPTFTYNNESVIIKPGNQFTMQELKSRLHQMDIDAIEVSSKPELVSLYESTLRDDRNKFKLFDRLQKDTILYNSKMGISVNTINDRMNPERSKVIGLKYEKQKIPYQETENKENNIKNAINKQNEMSEVLKKVKKRKLKEERTRHLIDSILVQSELRRRFINNSTNKLYNKEDEINYDNNGEKKEIKIKKEYQINNKDNKGGILIKEKKDAK